MALTKYRAVKKMNKNAIATPTAMAKKKSTVEGVFPTKDVPLTVLAAGVLLLLGRAVAVGVNDMMGGREVDMAYG